MQARPPRNPARGRPTAEIRTPPGVGSAFKDTTCCTTGRVGAARARSIRSSRSDPNQVNGLSRDWPTPHPASAMTARTAVMRANIVVDPPLFPWSPG